MSPSEAYIIPPTFGTHILFIPSPPAQHQQSQRPFADHSYSNRQALLLPAPYAIMSNKRVHWRDDVPRTPSPALSTSSQNSSVGPFTPPSAHTSLPQVAGYYPPRQYASHLAPHAPFMVSQPLPFSPALSSSSSGGSPLGLEVHYMLASAQHGSSSSRPFEWNLIEDPVKLVDSQREYLVNPSLLAQPATSPGVAELKIVCESLAWTIVVRPDPYYQSICVTVGDVLQQLYKSLRQSVSKEELSAIYYSRPDHRQAIDRAWETRCQMSTDPRGEQRRGIRRVDCLLGVTKFGGFKVVREKAGSTGLALMLKLR